MTSVYAGAPEQASIQTLLSQAPSYDIHVVTLQGITRNMQVMPAIPLHKCNLL
jgi:hypothetical protein